MNIIELPIEFEFNGQTNWIYPSLNNQCKVIATPGITSGHISLYFPSVESVITGMQL